MLYIWIGQYIWQYTVTLRTDISPCPVPAFPNIFIKMGHGWITSSVFGLKRSPTWNVWNGRCFRWSKPCPSNKMSLKSHWIIPIGSIYGIFTYICHKHQPNVGKYTRHGSYGIESPQKWHEVVTRPQLFKVGQLIFFCNYKSLSIYVPGPTSQKATSSQPHYFPK